MIYNYRCQQCNLVQEREIQTHDIMDSQGRVNQKKLTERMYSDMYCECGGQLKKLISVPQDALWFNAGIGKGKISQRFK